MESKKIVPIVVTIVILLIGLFIFAKRNKKEEGYTALNVTYKNWSLFASFLYEWGGQEYNQTLVDNVENSNIKT